MPQPDGVLLVDKPAGITSTKALALAKRALGAMKAGHTGTLDPFATGLLPLVFGEATKFSRFLIDSDKSYIATLALGQTSSTGDTEGDIRPGQSGTCTMADVERILTGLVGISVQIPPMHSAVRHQGQRLYDLARQGLEVERAPRQVRIDTLELVEIVGERLVISVKCSKGTYIRTLAQEIGERLGCGAYLTSLRRTATANFSVDEADTPEELARMGQEAARAKLLPVDALLTSLPRLELDPDEAWAIRNGQELDARPLWKDGEGALYSPDGLLIGVGSVHAGRLRAVRLLATGGVLGP